MVLGRDEYIGVQIRPEPRGVILNMSAWNYPAQLIFAPVVAAIAAGNRYPIAVALILTAEVVSSSHLSLLHGPHS